MFNVQDFIVKLSITSFLNKIKNVTYKGILNPESVVNILKQYKAVLLPSTVNEMSPLIIMQANIVKTPVIASDVFGSKELINKYDCGILFPNGSLNDFSKCINSIEKNELTFKFISNIEDSFLNIAKKHATIYSLYINKTKTLVQD